MSNITKYRIYYEDTDAEAIVYYANYLKFFERARTEFLRARNILQSQLTKEIGIVFVVGKCDIEYKSPAKLDDLITIKTAVSEIGNASLAMRQEMFLEEKLLTIFNVKIVCVDSTTLRPKKIPELILSKLNV